MCIRDSRKPDDKNQNPCRRRLTPQPCRARAEEEQGQGNQRGVSSVAVSYTHLDVYKRQFLASSDSSDPRERAVVETSVHLAKQLGMECCAEGVETPAQAAFLAGIHCEKGQGYLYSKPVDIAAFDSLLNQGFLDAPSR